MAASKSTKKSAEASAELVPHLPGEGSVDAELLDKAVAVINRIYVSKGLETARAIGNYVVEAFFGGDLESFGQRQKKHVTFRALAEREDLHVAYNTIWYSVAVLDQLRLLPEDVAEALPLSHHKLLLPVADADVKAKLAAKAVEEKLSSREFAEVVKAARVAQSGKPRGGRPPLPAVVKGIRRLQKAVALATSEDIHPETFKSSTDAAEFVAKLDQQMALLAELKEKVLAASTERGDSPT